MFDASFFVKLRFARSRFSTRATLVLVAYQCTSTSPIELKCHDIGLNISINHFLFNVLFSGNVKYRNRKRRISRFIYICTSFPSYGFLNSYSMWNLSNFFLHISPLWGSRNYEALLVVVEVESLIDDFSTCLKELILRHGNAPKVGY